MIINTKYSSTIKFGNGDIEVAVDSIDGVGFIGLRNMIAVPIGTVIPLDGDRSLEDADVLIEFPNTESIDILMMMLFEAKAKMLGVTPEYLSNMLAATEVQIQN